MRRRTLSLWTLSLACSLAAGCARQSVELQDRPCHEGLCADGYRCHPFYDTCVPPVTVSCDGAGVCPSETSTGTPCDTSGTFVPCSDDAAGCEAGCRTCGSDGRWGSCEYADAHCGSTPRCGADEVCVNDVCLRACARDTDCPPGYHCPATVCVPLTAVCGDGIQGGDEQCDGTDLAGNDCQSQGLGPGPLRCTPGCRFDTSACASATCGNLTVEPPETCDGPTLVGHTCQTEGFTRGTLACASDCTLDTTACVAGYCGDGVLDPSEACDGLDLGDRTCTDLDLGPGSLSCATGCTFVLSGCTGCGNGVKDGGETCDTGDLGDLTCPGGLACSPTCLLDFSGCTLPSTGNGADGALTVSTPHNLSQTSSPMFAVTAIGASQVTLGAAPTGLAPGDEALLINVQGGAADCGVVGQHEFLVVTATTGNDVTFQSAIAGTYGAAAGNSSLAGQKVVLARVPRFSRVQVQSGGVVTSNAWNGTTGGLVVMRVAGELVIDAGGQLSADGLGFRPGAGISAYYTGGKQGESTCGNPQTSSTVANNGGGGGGKYSNLSDDCGQGGGGGGFGQPGGWQGFETRCVNAGHTSPAANGGLAYGSDDLALLFLGSGGGSGATDDNSNTSGTGGMGGGLVLVFAAKVVVNGTLSARGTDGGRGTYINDSGNGGGGSGGTIFLSAAVLEGTGTLSAEGGLGLGSQGDWNAPGGNGGVGRIRVDYQTAGGAAFGTPEAQGLVAGLATPDPGYQALYVR